MFLPLWSAAACAGGHVAPSAFIYCKGTWQGDYEINVVQTALFGQLIHTIPKAALFSLRWTIVTEVFGCQDQDNTMFITTIGYSHLSKNKKMEAKMEYALHK